MRKVAIVVGVALIAILFVVAGFISSKTINLTTFDRRGEIAIMRMVGATTGCIRWPFVYEGFMLGLLGAVCRPLVFAPAQLPLLRAAPHGPHAHPLRPPPGPNPQNAHHAQRVGTAQPQLLRPVPP